MKMTVITCAVCIRILTHISPRHLGAVWPVPLLGPSCWCGWRWAETARMFKPPGALSNSEKELLLFKCQPLDHQKVRGRNNSNSWLQRWSNQGHHHPMALSTLTHQLLRPPHPQRKITESGRRMQVLFSFSDPILEC